MGKLWMLWRRKGSSLTCGKPGPVFPGGICPLRGLLKDDEAVVPEELFASGTQVSADS
jgi:hypothetical protein